jgi:hypothetical protein
MSYFPEIPIRASDSASLDAFGRWRVSNPVTLFDSQFQYDLQPLLWQQVTSGSVTITHLPNESAVQLNIASGASTTIAMLQTYDYIRYQPLKSQVIAMTFVLGSGTTNIFKEVGYGDDNDGLFLIQSGTALGFDRRTSTSGSPVDNIYLQSTWNLDTLDGSNSTNNPSGIRFDPTKSAILFMDLQWLGVGRVRFGFEIDGNLYYVHELRNANNLDKVYIKTANLPLRYKIRALSASGGNSIKAICNAVVSEGGVEKDRAYRFAVKNSAAVSLTTSNTPMIAIRPKLTFNGITNRTKVELDDLSILAGNNSVEGQVYYLPENQIVGGSWTSADSQSACEYNDNITSYSSGILVDVFYVASTNSAKGSMFTSIASRLPMTVDYSGLQRFAFLIVGKSVTSTSDSRAHFNWREFR